MPCKVCKTTLIFLDKDPSCPKCEKLSVVPYEDSLKISEYLISVFQKKFLKLVKNAKKRQLLANVFWYRERHVRRIYTSYTHIDVTQLLACNLLLRRLIQMDDFLEHEEINEEKIVDIIKLYTDLTQFEEDQVRLEAGNWSMLKLKKYDINNLEKMAFDAVVVCPNEKYDRVMKAFAKHNIMPQKKAEPIMKEWAKQLQEPIVPGSNRCKTSKETISRFYELISEFYTAFFRSRIYTEAFGLPSDYKISIDPIELQRFVGCYPMTESGLSYREFVDFRAELISKFGGRYKQFLKYFVISEENPATPLFLRLDDNVLISQAFTELFSYVLHAIINRDLFDAETEKLSKKFESQIVKNHFEKIGYKYIPNYVVKNKMEIDGIAISKANVFVIEVKGWKSRKLIEEKTSKDILLRDIKHAIEGLHLDYNSGKLKTKVSLPKKVKWVNENRKKFDISDSAEIKGMLVINDEPIISEYNDCTVKFVNDFETNSL